MKGAHIRAECEGVYAAIGNDGDEETCFDDCVLACHIDIDGGRVHYYPESNPPVHLVLPRLTLDFTERDSIDDAELRVSRFLSIQLSEEALLALLQKCAQAVEKFADEKSRVETVLSRGRYREEEKLRQEKERLEYQIWMLENEIEDLRKSKTTRKKK